MGAVNSFLTTNMAGTVVAQMEGSEVGLLEWEAGKEEKLGELQARIVTRDKVCRCPSESS